MPTISELITLVGVNTLLTIMICSQFLGAGVVLATLVSWIQ